MPRETSFVLLVLMCSISSIQPFLATKLSRLGFDRGQVREESVRLFEIQIRILSDSGEISAGKERDRGREKEFLGPPTFDSYPDRRRDPSLSRPQPVRSSVHPLVVRTYLRPTDGLTSRPERSSCKSKEVSATLVAPSIIVPFQTLGVSLPPFLRELWHR